MAKDLAKSNDKPVAAPIAVYEGDPYALLRRTPDELGKIVRANLGANSQISEFELDRVGVPTGGGLTWTVPDLAGEPLPVQELVGVVLYHADRRAYWEVPFEESGGGLPPDCSSLDSIMGRGYLPGDPRKNAQNQPLAPVTRQCASCPMSQWGSANPDDEDDQSPACSLRKLIFLVRPEDSLPLVIDLAPTSCGPFRSFMLRMTSRFILHTHVIIGLSLRQEQSNGGIKHSVVKPRLIETLPDEQADRMDKMAEVMRPFFDKVGAEPIAPQYQQPTSSTPSAPNAEPAVAESASVAEEPA